MSKRISSRYAKRRVVAICEVLAASNPRMSNRRIQNATIDLHDIEVACEKGQTSISRLRRHDPKDTDETRSMLIGVDIGVLDELASHISSLRRFFREIGVRDPSVGGKPRERL